MKLIHCADLHLDSSMSKHFDKQKSKERKAELLDTFRRLVEYANRENVRGIIIAGDLFDGKNITKTCSNTVSSLIENNKDIDFFYLKGNHDADSFLDNLEEVPENLKIFDERWTKFNVGKNIVVSGIVFNDQNKLSAAASLLLDALDVNIVVMHGQESEGGSRDKAEIINIKDYKNKNIDYVALGHIHQYKREKLDARGIWSYSGCLEGRGFDECGEKGFVLLDIDEEKKTVTDTFVPFAKRTLCEVPVDISKCKKTSEIVREVSEKLEKMAINAGNLVKVVLTGQVSCDCEKDIYVVSKQFEDDYFFFKVKDETGIYVDINEYALDKSLKGEFVRTVFANDSLSEEDKKEVIRIGLRALRGEEF